MSIQAQLITLLSGATAAGTNVFALTALDSQPGPYITYQRVSGVDDTALAGPTGLTNTRMQVDCYADTYAAAVALAAQVKALLAGWAVQNVQILDQDLYEPDVKLFRVLLDYSIWHT